MGLITGPTDPPSPKIRITKVTLIIEDEDGIPSVAIEERVKLKFANDKWKVSNEGVVGIAEYKNQAILNYLSARLGLPRSHK